MIIQELKTIQKVHGYLPVEEFQALSRRLQVPLYRLYSVASFYPHFRLQPPPAIDIKICNDVACYLRGITDLHEIIRTAVNALSLSDVHITSTSCLGQCDGAPAVAINDQSYTEVSAQRITGLLDTLANGRTLRRQRLITSQQTFACDPYNGQPKYDALRRLVQRGEATTVIAALKESGLRGMGGAGFPTGVKWELVALRLALRNMLSVTRMKVSPELLKTALFCRPYPTLSWKGWPWQPWLLVLTRRFCISATSTIANVT
jgi:NADH:ubiquinone oxidoreductase subunit E